jgi:hypothetical protein
MALTDVDDSLGDGHLMHNTLHGKILNKKKPAEFSAGFSY